MYRTPFLNVAELLHRIAGGDRQLLWAHGILVRQVGHLTKLVDDLLDISLITRGALQLQLQPVDVGRVIANALEGAEPLIRRKRHLLSSQLPSRPVWVQGDAIRLTQVFENLLTNAAKYMDDGGEIALTLVVDDGMATTRVRDTGFGIAADMKTRMFELFVQDARSVDRSEGGLGIGLTLVRHLVELHGGTIEAVSDGPGRGTEFIVRIAEANAPAPVAIVDDERLEVGAGRVLVIDDDPDAGESIALLLELYGYETRRAFGIDSARAFRPQAVLSDIAMPVADGYEVARRLRLLPEMAECSIYLAMSGFAQPAPSPRTEAAGFAGYLVKPLDPAALHARLTQALGGVGVQGAQP